jgi:hypothetical protein
MEPEFEITLWGIDTSQLTILSEFVKAFDLDVQVNAITAPNEQRQRLRLPPVGGVAIQLSRNRH